MARGDTVSLELRGRRYKGGLGPVAAQLGSGRALARAHAAGILVDVPLEPEPRGDHGDLARAVSGLVKTATIDALRTA